MSKPQQKRRYRKRKRSKKIDLILDHVEALMGREDNETSEMFLTRSLLQRSPVLSHLLLFKP